MKIQQILHLDQKLEVTAQFCPRIHGGWIEWWEKEEHCSNYPSEWERVMAISRIYTLKMVKMSSLFSKPLINFQKKSTRTHKTQNSRYVCLILFKIEVKNHKWAKKPLRWKKTNTTNNNLILHDSLRDMPRGIQHQLCKLLTWTFNLN